MRAMAIIESAKKANRQAIRRGVYNARRERAYKSALKEYRALLVKGSTAEAVKMVPTLFMALDKAVKRGVIKKNTASRLKSRLTKSR